MTIDEIAFRLWRDCIRPAARYDRWVPSEAYADAQGYTEVATTPVLDVAGHKCVVCYWRSTDDAGRWWLVISTNEADDATAAREYDFWDGQIILAPHNLIFKWNAHDAPSTAILACPVELPEQLEMVF